MALIVKKNRLGFPKYITIVIKFHVSSGKFRQEEHIGHPHS